MDKDWDIDPPGVRGVLLNTAEIIGQIEGEGKSLSALVESAAASSGTILGNDVAREGKPVVGDAYANELGLVAVALAEYFKDRGVCLEYMVARSGRSLDGATGATTAYIDGDLEMAAEAQRNALLPPEGFEAPRVIPASQTGAEWRGVYKS
ncbi:DUF6507 family protein [Streptomyces sp. SAJ15]|uniref:DUF6507 family protein n=1 Tax=Streptomyces sp. SAJ15 TaxID=2011095 RepID=UPI001184B8DF|nr:DUF6507 family protein [Streptomyces sp. SAJ15]TVL90452.1 hypothetical protein CD790_20950 [Streptomyces sp. SAJ15]